MFIIFDQSDDGNFNISLLEDRAKCVDLSFATIYQNQVREWPFFVIESAIYDFLECSDIAIAFCFDIKFSIEIFISLAVDESNHRSRHMFALDIGDIIAFDSDYCFDALDDSSQERSMFFEYSRSFDNSGILKDMLNPLKLGSKGDGFFQFARPGHGVHALAKLSD